MPQHRQLLLVLHSDPWLLRLLHRAHDRQVLLQLDARPQLQSLDFARMDLSEFYTSLVAKSPNLSAIQTNNGARVPSCYFGQGKC